MADPCPGIRPRDWHGAVPEELRVHCNGCGSAPQGPALMATEVQRLRFAARKLRHGGYNAEADTLENLSLRLTSGAQEDHDG